MTFDCPPAADAGIPFSFDLGLAQQAESTSSAVKRVGVIRNPNSQRNRRTGDQLASVVPPRGIELLRVDARSADDLGEVIEEYAARGVSHLLVDGGDGTLRDVMTALPPAFGERLPTLMLLAGGNANLAAADVAGAGHGPQAMQRLLDTLARGERARVHQRRPIELRWPGESRAPVLGFFIGGGVFHKGWRLAVGSVQKRGLMHGPALAATLAGAAWKTLAGRSRGEWLAGSDIGIGIDGKAVDNRQRFLFLATGLDRLFGQLWPFFDHGDEPIRWLDIDAPPPRFARTLPSLLLGNPNRWARESGAYRSGGADHIALRLETPLVVDGEAYTPGPYGLVELRAGPRLDFYSPERL